MFWIDVVKCAGQCHLLSSGEWRRAESTWQGASESHKMQNNLYNGNVMISAVAVTRSRWGQE